MITKQERLQALKATGVPVYFKPNDLEFIVNLTPHDILVSGVIKRVDSKKEVDTLIEIPASGRIARVETKATPLLPSLSFPAGAEQRAIISLKKQRYGRIVGLPAYVASGPRYIVSSIVLMAVKEMMPDRPDVFAPDTLNAVRDEDGTIISVPGFVQ